MVVNSKSIRMYGGVTPEARDAQRRDALITAGIALFGERGYAASTIEALCGAASISTRDFYSYFGNKEELMLAVYNEIIERTAQAVGEAVGEALERSEDASEVIRAGIGTFAHSMLDDERWARINFIEIVGISPRVELRRREVIGLFGSFVAATNATLVQRGLIDRTTLSPVHSVAMVGAVHETLTDWVTRSDRPPLEQSIDALVAIFTAVIRR